MKNETIGESDNGMTNLMDVYTNATFVKIQIDVSREVYEKMQVELPEYIDYNSVFEDGVNGLVKMLTHTKKDLSIIYINQFIEDIIEKNGSKDMELIKTLIDYRKKIESMENISEKTFDLINEDMRTLESMYNVIKKRIEKEMKIKNDLLNIELLAIELNKF
jgi:hypothetical protein